MGGPKWKGSGARMVWEAAVVRLSVEKVSREELARKNLQPGHSIMRQEIELTLSAFGIRPFDPVHSPALVRYSNGKEWWSQFTDEVWLSIAAGLTLVLPLSPRFQYLVSRSASSTSMSRYQTSENPASKHRTIAPYSSLACLHQLPSQL